jgi:hypothetical protein
MGFHACNTHTLEVEVGVDVVRSYVVGVVTVRIARGRGPRPRFR